MSHSKLAGHIVECTAQTDVILAQDSLEQISLVLTAARLHKVLCKQDLDGGLGQKDQLCEAINPH